MKKGISMLLAILLVLSLSACKQENRLESDLNAVLSEAGSSGPKDGSWTILVYLIGSNLESEAGQASQDLIEMMDAGTSDQVRLLVQTGGARQWMLEGISSQRGERYLRHNTEELVLVNELPGNVSMTQPDTLADFIRFGRENYPAEHYALVLWDHGGGPLGGFGMDEFYPEDSMSLPELKEALDDGGVYFDFIGFDACLMATLETAYTLRDNGDYLIASAQLEPGGGWDYTGWLDALAKEPEQNLQKLGQTLIDDYIADCHALDYPAEGVLAMIDLNKIDPLYQTVCGFLREADEQLLSADYKVVAQARAGAKDYGGGFEQIDLAQFAWLTGAESAGQVQQALDEAVVCVGRTDTLQESCGLAFYFPFARPEYYGGMLEQMEAIGITGDYQTALTRFASILASNQLSANATGYDWYQEPVQQFHEFYQGALSLEQVNGLTVVPLSAEDWGVISNYRDVCALKEDDGIRMLGATLPLLDEYGNVIVTWLKGWWSIGGSYVAYFLEEVYTPDCCYGYVPALLSREDGTEVHIELVVYTEGQYSYHAGYRIVENMALLAERGLRTLQPGDRLRFLYERSNSEGVYEVIASDRIFTVGQDDLSIASKPLPENSETCHIIEITDVFNNQFTAEPVWFRR